jgi:hypothetical protein
MATDRPPFEAIGLLTYDPETDTLSAIACPSDGPPITVTVRDFLAAAVAAQVADYAARPDVRARWADDQALIDRTSHAYL